MSIYRLIVFFLILSSGVIKANGIEVTNVRVVNRDTVSHTVWILADIQWENAWRLDSVTAPYNYDAAWVFIKIPVTDSSSHHLIMNPEGVIAPVGSQIEVAPGGEGLFIFCDTTYHGDVIFKNLAIQWNYASAGLSDTSVITAYVHAIEMVYIPEGEFIAGTAAGGAEINPFIPTTINTGLATLPPTGSAGIDSTATGGYPTGQIAPDFNNFPNGYKAIYCMKYELVQEQYASFLNDLSPGQAAYRFQPLETLDKQPYRYNIYIDSLTGLYTSANPYLPINVLSYQDGAAYCDWAGLRILTELEFEKICRGPGSSIPGTFPWGDSTYSTNDYYIINAGTDNELIGLMDYSRGSAYYKGTNGSISGPVRSGIFAATSILPTRKATGASYYGVMDMGGNILERVVVFYTPEGRAYRGTHGDGYLDVSGFHTNSDWPTTATAAYGISARGGKWNSEIEKLLISDRSLVSSPLSSRYHNAGFRFARTSYE